MSRTPRRVRVCSRGSRGRAPAAGFTLLELLVASTVVAIAGTVAAVCLMAAFRTWESCVRTGAAGESATELCDALGADFDGLVAGCGFSGAGDACRFWVLTAAAGRAAAPTLEEVRYAFAGSVCLRRSTDVQTGRAIDVRFRGPFRTAVFDFGDTGSNGLAWQPEWQNTSNAPAALRLSLATAAGPERARVFVGRDTP